MGWHQQRRHCHYPSPVPPPLWTTTTRRATLAKTTTMTNIHSTETITILTIQVSNQLSIWPMKTTLYAVVTCLVPSLWLNSTSTQAAQDMLFLMSILESLGLKVQKPMILMLDNSGAHDLTHNWSIGGCTRHVDVRMHFLQELKEDGIIICDWVSGNDILQIYSLRTSKDRSLTSTQVILLDTTNT
jgi:hypothetical protein